MSDKNDVEDDDDGDNNQRGNDCLILLFFDIVVFFVVIIILHLIPTNLYIWILAFSKIFLRWSSRQYDIVHSISLINLNVQCAFRDFMNDDISWIMIISTRVVGRAWSIHLADHDGQFVY